MNWLITLTIIANITKEDCLLTVFFEMHQLYGLLGSGSVGSHAQSIVMEGTLGFP